MSLFQPAGLSLVFAFCTYGNAFALTAALNSFVFLQSPSSLCLHVRMCTHVLVRTLAAMHILF